jgi:hypothetical protein
VCVCDDDDESHYCFYVAKPEREKQKKLDAIPDYNGEFAFDFINNILMYCVCVKKNIGGDMSQMNGGFQVSVLVLMGFIDFNKLNRVVNMLEQCTTTVLIKAIIVSFLFVFVV